MLSAIHYQGHTSSELESCASMTMEAPGMLLWLLELGLKRRRGAQGDPCKLSQHAASDHSKHAASVQLL